MKKTFAVGIPFLMASGLFAEPPQPPANKPVRYLSAIQLNVIEPRADLTERAQHLVVENFSNAAALSPVLRPLRYETKVNGNEVHFFMSSDEDMRAPVQEVLTAMIQNLNGRVLARGKSQFYRAAMSQPIGGYLEVIFDETNSKIQAISAQSVTLREVLKEIRNQSGNVSYLIPGECAEKIVDWSFGDSAGATAKEVDLVMSELATLFSLKMEKKNGTYIFTGQCHDRVGPRRSLPAQGDVLQSAGFGGAQVMPIFVPVMP